MYRDIHNKRWLIKQVNKQPGGKLVIISYKVPQERLRRALGYGKGGGSQEA